MADNVAITPGSGATIATDDVGGAQYQRIKLDLGGDGASSPLLRGQQTKANSLPVVLASDHDLVPVSDNGGSLTVDCMMACPSVRWGRRRALRSWMGLFDRGHLGPAGVTV